MKKSKKMMLRIMPVVMLLAVVLITSGSVFGYTDPSVVDVMDPTNVDNKITQVVGNAWGTVLTILQVLSVAAVVYAGVRYMFASADQKFEIKKGLGALAIGAILVFGASTVIQFLVTGFGEIVQ